MYSLPNAVNQPINLRFRLWDSLGESTDNDWQVNAQSALEVQRLTMQRQKSMC